MNSILDVIVFLCSAPRAPEGRDIHHQPHETMNEDSTIESIEKPARHCARNGKIARLPAAVREELNQRLLDGEAGPALIEWLNALPEAQAALQRNFAGRPMTEQNLSEWRQGGFRDWLAKTEANACLAETLTDGPAPDAGTGAGDKKASGEGIADRVAAWFFPITWPRREGACWRRSPPTNGGRSCARFAPTWPLCAGASIIWSV